MALRVRSRLPGPPPQPLDSIACPEPFETYPDDMPTTSKEETQTILRMTQLLEKSSIPCYLSGVSALIYYGANRVRNDWEICIPTSQLDGAVYVLQSHSSRHDYQTMPATNPTLGSLTHTFPRFKCIGKRIHFLLIPSYDCHISCEDPNIQRSLNNLPYPKLDVFIQSLLLTNDTVALCDVVDGSNVSEAWGIENLQLSGTNDIEWIRWKNNLIQAHNGGRSLCEVETRTIDLRSLWQDVVRGKKKRLSFKHPRDVFATRFRLLNDQDPWLYYRDVA